VIGRLKKDRVYCANTTELVALNLITSELTDESIKSALRTYAREKHCDDCKGSRNKESRAWVSLLEKYNFRAGASGKEAGKFRIAKQCDCAESQSLSIRSAFANGNHIPRANMGEIAHKDRDKPTEPTEFKTTPGTEKIPDPSNCPRFSITADSIVTS
jgi:hypothetical protein